MSRTGTIVMGVVTAGIPSDERPICMELDRRLHAAWGPAMLLDQGATQVWIHPTTRDRATLRDCVVTFDRAE